MTELQKQEAKESQLKEAGGESALLDYKSIGSKVIKDLRRQETLGRITHLH